MTVDVCLILEGTYPFVSGGVSSWVHHLTSKLPHISFYILHISPKRGFYTKGHVYDMPDNVKGVREVYLHDYVLSSKGRPTGLAEKVEFFRQLVEDMREGRSGSFAAFLRALQSEGNEGFSAFDLLQTFESWEVLVDNYRREAGNESFLNFFWTWRYAYLPLFNLLSARIPRARVYHTISTGYAGLLAAGAKERNGSPMLLTEHGIYTKERRIEINRSDWIQDWDSGEIVAERKAPYFRRYWIRQFQMMSRITYEYADEIFTLYTGNAEEQIRDGADPNKIRVIPNGIDMERFGEAADRFDARGENDRFTVCFLGRVCPIKDLMTFIGAMRLVADEVPDVRVRVLGPMDEDPEYAEMCQRHARQLGLEQNLAFEGKVDVLQELPKCDVMVLTSISEAQPLVILEAGSIGVPSIATNVGSCADLLYGATPEDRVLGAGGAITPMASPGETARAVLQLYYEPELRKRMRDAMRERVLRFYNQDDMVAAYDEIYTGHANKSPIQHLRPDAEPDPEPDPDSSHRSAESTAEPEVVPEPELVTLPIPELPPEPEPEEFETLDETATAPSPELQQTGVPAPKREARRRDGDIPAPPETDLDQTLADVLECTRDLANNPEAPPPEEEIAVRKLPSDATPTPEPDSDPDEDPNATATELSSFISAPKARTNEIREANFAGDKPTGEDDA